MTLRSGIANLFKVQFGVSATDDGLKILRPSGCFGKRYRFTEALFSKFVATMTAVFWMTTLLVVAAFVCHVTGHINAGQLVELIVLICVFGDMVRVASVAWVFRGTPRLSSASLISEGRWERIEGRFPLVDPYYRSISVGCYFFEFLLILSTIVDLVVKSGTKPGLVVLVIVLHGGAYLSRFFVANRYY
jgi:hypothetical protein